MGEVIDLRDRLPAYLGALRVRHLRPWHRIHLHCHGCGHEGLIEPAQFTARHEPNEFLWMVMHFRVACAACGQKWHPHYRLVRLEDGRLVDGFS